MKNFSPRRITFLCCNNILTFNYPGEFHMCPCGKCGYDAGDGYYSRFLGEFDLIKVEKLLPKNIEQYIKDKKLFTCTENDVTIFSDSTTKWKIFMLNTSRYKLESEGKILGYFSALKDAYKRARKL